jgi:hypothetical protein
MAEGISMIQGFPDSEPRFARSGAALVVLTDGENDMDRHPEKPCARVTDTIVKKLILNVQAPPVYFLAFGPEVPVDSIAGVFHGCEDKTRILEIGTGEDAASELGKAYMDILKEEAHSWYVDLEFEKGVDLKNLRITVGEGPFLGMLFLPSPLVKMTTRGRLLVIGIAGLALILLANIWYLYRYRWAIRQAPAAQPVKTETEATRQVRRQETEETPRGMSVQEWERRKGKTG